MSYISKIGQFVMPMAKKAVSGTALETLGTRAIKPQRLLSFPQKSNFMRGSDRIFTLTTEAANVEFKGRQIGLLDLLRTRGTEDELASSIIRGAKPETIDFFERIIQNPKTDLERLKRLSPSLNKENKKAIESIILDKSISLDKIYPGTTLPITEGNVGIFKYLTGKGIGYQYLEDILSKTKNNQIAKAIESLVKHKGVNINKHLDMVCYLLQKSESKPEVLNLQTKFISDICKNKDLKIDNLYRLKTTLANLTENNYNFASKLLTTRADLKGVDNLIFEYSMEPSSFYDKLIDFAPKNYNFHDFSINSTKTGEKYLDGLKNITSEADKIKLLDLLPYLRKEEEAANIIRLVNENPDRIAQISMRVLVNKFLARAADKTLADRIIKTLEESGRDCTKSEIFALIRDYPFAEETVEKAFKKLYNNPKFTTGDIIQMQQDWNRNANVKNDILEQLFGNEKLSAEDIKSLYIRIQNGEDALRILKYMDNPKFVQARNLHYANDEELEFLLNSKVLKTENYGNYISAIHADKHSAQETKELWELLEKLIKKHPGQEEKITSIIYNINHKNKKFVEALIRRDMDLNDVRMIISDHFADHRWLTNEEMEFFKKIVDDKRITNDGINTLFSESIKPDYKEIGELYAKYPARLRKALNLGIRNANEELIKNKNFDSILEQIKNLKKEHNIEIEYPISVATDGFFKGNSNDLFIALKTHDGTVLKFSKKNGELITISKDNISYNIKNGVRSNSFELRENRGIGEVPYYIESYLEKPGQTPVKQIYTETMPGQYEIYSHTPTGKKLKIGKAVKFPNGTSFIRRKLKSLDGTTSIYRFRQDPEGNRFLHTIIKSPKGEIISDTKRTFQKLSEDHFISTLNGKAYDVEFFNDRVVATKLDEAGKKTSEFVEYKIADIDFDFEKNIKEFEEKVKKGEITIPKNIDEKDIFERLFKELGIKPYTIDRKTVDLMKNLTGDEWFAMKKSCPYVILDIGKYNKNNACFAGSPIFMSKELLGHYGVFAHELGHAKFQALGLLKDKKLMRIYNAEKRRFTQMFPETNIDYISYFLEGNAVELRGVNEGCAETNLLSNIAQSWGPIQARTVIWEQYFPNTRAYVEKKFQELI